MAGLFDELGLPKRLASLYSRLSKDRRLIEHCGERLVINCDLPEKKAKQASELIQLGFAYLKMIGKRRVLVLGTWEVAERRLVGGKAIKSSIFNKDMLEMLGRYSEADLGVLETAFLLFASTRKSNAMAPRILVRCLASYERYPVHIVMGGLRAYNEGNYIDRGCREEYALGIIRGINRDSEVQIERQTQPLPAKIASDAKAVKVASKKAAKASHQKAVDERVLQLIETDGCKLKIVSPQKLAEYQKRAEDELSK